MRSFLRLAVLALFASSVSFAADQSWTGKISDSKCGATHKSGGEHDAKMTNADCTKACVKGGAKYVFVHEGKILNISNQDFADLEKHAGHTVKLTGEMTGDSINVSKIEMREKSTKPKDKNPA
jgi:hypothetical protein